MRVGEGMEKITDPRSDITTDHAYWHELLWNCRNFDQSLYYLLHGIRSGGGEIIKTQNSFNLRPGEWSETEWEEIKRDSLSPFKDKLIEVFKLTRFGYVTNEKLPDGVFGQKG